MALGPKNMHGPAFSVEDLCTLEPLPHDLSNQLVTWQAAQEKLLNKSGHRSHRPEGKQNSSKDKNRSEEQRRIPLREFRTINQFNHDLSTVQVIKNYRLQITYPHQTPGKDSPAILKKNVKNIIEIVEAKEKPVSAVTSSQCVTKSHHSRTEIQKVGSTPSNASCKSTQKTKLSGKEKEPTVATPKSPVKSKTSVTEIPGHLTKSNSVCMKETFKPNFRNKPALEPKWRKWLAKRRTPKKEVAVCSTLQLGDEDQQATIQTMAEEYDEDSTPTLKFETPPLRHYLPQIQKPAIIGMKKTANKVNTIECHQTNLTLPNINVISSQVNVFRPTIYTDLSSCLSITSMGNNK